MTRQLNSFRYIKYLFLTVTATFSQRLAELSGSSERSSDTASKGNPWQLIHKQFSTGIHLVKYHELRGTRHWKLRSD